MASPGTGPPVLQTVHFQHCWIHNSYTLGPFPIWSACALVTGTLIETPYKTIGDRMQIVVFVYICPTSGSQKTRGKKPLFGRNSIKDLLYSAVVSKLPAEAEPAQMSKADLHTGSVLNQQSRDSGTKVSKYSSVAVEIQQAFSPESSLVFGIFCNLDWLSQNDNTPKNACYL